MIKETQRFDLLGLLPSRSLEDTLQSPPVERSSQYLRTPQFSDEDNWRDWLCEDAKVLERALMALEDVRSSALRSSSSLVYLVVSRQEAVNLQNSVADLLTQGWSRLQLGAVQVTVQLDWKGAPTEKDLLTDTGTTLCLDASEEAELARLREEALQLRQQGQRFPAVQRELDYAEDLFVRVSQGEDNKRLRSQLRVLANALVQAKAQQVAADTAKLATSLSARLQALEQISSPSKFRFTRPPLTSPRPQTVRKEEHLRVQLDCYHSLDDAFALERGRLRAIAQELQVRKLALDRREQALFQQEVAVALREDQLRATICRTLLTSEARDYMHVRASELQQEQFLLHKDRQHLEAQTVLLQRREREVAELRKVLERRLRKAAKEQARAQESEKKLMTAREQLRFFALAH